MCDFKPIKSLLLVLLFISSSFVGAQTPAENLVRQAEEEFSLEKYENVLLLSKQFYNQYPSADSIFYEMKKWEYLSHNRLSHDDIAQQILRSVINGGVELAYKDFGNVSRHYRNYLVLSKPQEDIATYEKAVRGILQQNNHSFYYTDYIYYYNLLQYKYGKLPYDIKLEAFSEEDLIVKDYHKSYLQAYYNYAKGCIILKGVWDGVSYLLWECQDPIQISKACSFLRIAEKLFQENGYRNETITKYHNLTLDKLCDAYRDLASYEAAAFYYKKKLDYLYTHWQELSRKSPWDAGENTYYPHPFTAYEEYVELLYDSNQYVEIINYTNNILKNPQFEEYKEYSDYLNYHILRAKKKLGIHNGPEFIYRNRYCKFYEYSHVENSYSFSELMGSDIPINEVKEQYLKGESVVSKETLERLPYLEFYRYLIERKDYQKLIDITNSVLAIFYADEWYLVDPYDNYDSETRPYEVTEYDKRIASCRDLWHHANGGDFMWLSYKYRAIAYSRLGNYDKAVENQIICVDIVRTDWKFEPDERKKIFSHTWDNVNNYSLYPSVEMEELFSLAEYYRLSGDNENAANTYREVLSLNREIISKFLYATSWDEKVKQWNVNNKIYRDIIRKDNIVNNPYFSDLVFECSSMLKSFLLNIKLNEHAAIDASDSKETQELWEKKLMLDIKDEREHFSDDVRSSFLDAIELGAELESIIPNTLPSEHIYLEVSNQLKNNEVLVDFFITADGKFEYLKPYSDEWKSAVYQDISACIIRKGWEKPKVVSLDNISEYLTTLLLPEQSISACHSIEFGKAIWSQIIEDSEVVPGDVIYFIPTGLLHQISLENLLIDDEQYISDIYELYRLTSYRQILYPSEKIELDDRWALFANGGHLYSERVGTKCNTEYMDLAQLKINKLDELPGTRRTLNYIRKNENEQCLCKLYKGFNEAEFAKLNMTSPELIYIGSHGYYMKGNLNPKDSLYLFGQNRTVMLSNEETSMYKTGIVMDHSPKYSTTMSDGLLTSKEISLLDLSTTKLACVSACSTGLGSTTYEGVYGLQRGFKLAGVQSLLVSLWDVDDKATEILMKSFYDNIRKGYNKLTSLKNAQKQVREYVEEDNSEINLGEPHPYADPYYWAGFVIIDGNEKYSNQ